MALDANTVPQKLFGLRLSDTYFDIVRSLMDGPKTAVQLAEVTGMPADVVRIRVSQLRLKLETRHLSISRMGDGPVPNGGPPRTYKLIEVAKPAAAPVEPEPEAPAPAVDEEVAGWVPDFSNRDLNVFHSELATEVAVKLGARCPCCRHPMVRPRKRNSSAENRRDRPSVAHNVATAFGGCPTVYVIACVGCNKDQRQLSFRQWANELVLAGDRRGPYVSELADIVESWLERTGTPDKVKMR